MSFKVGDLVWLGRYGQRQVQRPCPVCFGEKHVTLILGDGSHCLLECDYCDKGCLEPQGVVSEYEFTSDPDRMIIREVRSSVTVAGTTHEYHSHDGHYSTDENTFATEAEARAYGEKVAEKERAEHEQRAEYIKKNARKSFGWNAGYHMREAKRERASAERHERMAHICREREKEGERP